MHPYEDHVCAHFGKNFEIFWFYWILLVPKSSFCLKKTKFSKLINNVSLQNEKNDDCLLIPSSTD